jgi:hypothetical protein
MMAANLIDLIISGCNHHPDAIALASTRQHWIAFSWAGCALRLDGRPHLIDRAQAKVTLSLSVDREQ